VNALAGKSLVILNTSVETIELLTTWFEGQGMVVHAATVTQFRRDGRDLARFIAAAAPDVVIFDVALPYVANWQYLRDVLDNGPLKDIPVVVTTPNAQALCTVTNMCDPGVVFEIVGKPADMQELTSRVTSYLGLRV
jgi:CheY-like chemotaxis protein